MPDLPATRVPDSELTVVDRGGSIWWDDGAMMQAQKVAKVFASSQLVPDALRGKTADCIIALGMAREMKLSPILVLQNIHFVNGKAGFMTQFMIARANKSGAIKGRITWKTTSDGTIKWFGRERKNMVVTASAILADTGDVVDASATMEMALAENWTKNKKYQSMPEHMLRWRSAAMLIRLYLPEVMMGLQSTEELETLNLAPRRVDVTPEDSARPVNPAAAALGFSEPAGPVSDEVPPEVEVVAAVEAPAEDPAPRKTADIKADCAVIEGRIGPELTGKVRRQLGLPADMDVQSSRLRSKSAESYLSMLRQAEEAMREVEVEHEAPPVAGISEVPPQPDFDMDDRIARAQELRNMDPRAFWETFDVITGIPAGEAPANREKALTLILDCEYPLPGSEE